MIHLLELKISAQNVMWDYTEGKHDVRMTLPELEAPFRTDDTFSLQHQPDYHVGVCPFTAIQLPKNNQVSVR